LEAWNRDKVHITIENIEPETHCWLEQFFVEDDDLDALKRLLDIDVFELHRVYEIDAGKIAALEGRYGFQFRDKTPIGVISFSEKLFKWPANHIHTNRELRLMLDGKKPFAAFTVEVGREAEVVVLWQSLFQPYVDQGRFIKREEEDRMTSQSGAPVKLRRICYAIPGEEWRIDAFLALWRMTKKSGWNNGFEKMEGYLYGYNTDIDPFFVSRE
jgi:hypothetical protein